MKNFLLIATAVLLSAACAEAQKDKGKKDDKFDRRLLCPFERGMGREPKEAFTWDPPDMKVIMISKMDTAVRSCIDSKVLSINPTEEGRYEMVIFYKEYYFWYYGIKKPLVNINQELKAGEVLGTYEFGEEMEFRMFKDEEMMDPRSYLECTINEEKKDGRKK